MKDGSKRYATKERFKQKGYFRKHRDGGSGREAYQTGRRNRLLESRQEQKEEIDTKIELYGKVVLLTEDVVYIGEDDGKDATDAGRTRRGNEVTQPESGEGGVVAVQPVPRKPIKRGRKTRSVKKNDERPQKKDG